MIRINKGNIIKSDGWADPVRVDIIEECGKYYRIIGETVNTGKYFNKIVSKEDFEKISIEKIEIDFSANPKHVFSALETKRYRYISLYDPLFAINTSKVDPLPHQIDAVYGHILKLPRIRFLIADDPGAGKTIMAGLIIKELKFRHVINRVLIVTPGHLKDQWRRELKERFEENFVIIDRGMFGSYYGENVWQRENQILTSIDFVKQEDILPGLSSCKFDMIIVDEAHKMSAYKYGNKTEKTSRYKLGETLSKIGEHILFLTATPHKGDAENFRLFLDLLEPGFFATTEMLEESINEKDNPLFIRRVKEDLKNFEGEPLFLPRYVKTNLYNLGTQSPDEKRLYNELSDYVNTQYNKALTRGKKRNIAFALVILQRRFASSTYALFKSLERRKKRLADMIDSVMEGRRSTDIVFDFDDIEEMSEEERWKHEEIWEALSVAENREELRNEINILANLSKKATGIIDEGKELKLQELKKTLESLKQNQPDEKIIIFTESKDTLEYLQKKVRFWGYSATVIHGGMNLEERVKAETIFKNETQMLIATEAAGEGINLQFCHLMINYDIPWNPNRLEQRMGRIHRYGQNKEVFVFNLVAEDTREGRVLKKLFEKIDEIRKALGSDKVFDVISEVMYGKNLSQLLLDAAANARNMDDILSEIDIEVDEKYIAEVKESLGESLATHFIDYTQIKEIADRAKEYRLIPEYTEAFFKKVYKMADGKISDRKDNFTSIDSIPYDIRSISEEENFKKKYGSLLKKYHQATFDKEKAFKHPDAEFLSFGHPLFEAVLEWCDREMSQSLTQGAVFTDPDGKLDGTVMFYEGEIKDGKESIAGRRLFAFYIDGKTGEIRVLNPSFIWDLIEDGKTAEKADIRELENKVFSKLMPVLEKYKTEILSERQRQADIKEKYGIKSLEYLISKLDRVLIDLGERKENGEKVDIVIYNRNEEKKKYENSLENLKKTIRYEKTLNISAPKFVGIMRVISRKEAISSMESSEEIEKIGMDTAIRYEKEKGRLPEDVSSENLGFDIRSTDENGGKRYIEVKARAGVGSIAMTPNEWFKALRFGNDYYLYVVFNASTEPDLKIVPNPAENLNAREKAEIVRYLIGSQDIVQWTQKEK